MAPETSAPWPPGLMGPTRTDARQRCWCAHWQGVRLAAVFPRLRGGFWAFEYGGPVRDGPSQSAPRSISPVSGSLRRAELLNP